MIYDNIIRYTILYYNRSYYHIRYHMITSYYITYYNTLQASQLRLSWPAAKHIKRGGGYCWLRYCQLESLHRELLVYFQRTSSKSSNWDIWARWGLPTVSSPLPTYAPYLRGLYRSASRGRRKTSRRVKLPVLGLHGCVPERQTESSDAIAKINCQAIGAPVCLATLLSTIVILSTLLLYLHHRYA